MPTGHCLCGNIRYAFDAPLREPVICHCKQCRRQAGNGWASVSVAEDALTIDGPVRWYRASDAARRGFCGDCGSFLFWAGDGEGEIAVSMGSMDEPTGMMISQHIFVADKGDCYHLNDGLPQRDQ
ncbi:aldehyde-activating protein [Actibacterium mucosum KCTC 23349]|uniref:Aldehyde-activating protein n=1 Tax=Actibacterium mucosum KCTC 23349 TaxID=1454373 RepID=A0A037ZM38_9RHOB|nr:GFA family protein [Actibacterium mucosum]KAJ57486.1 aldehyde-activating protein [Actibacterium mucosum KCTC 23349]